MSEDMFHRRGQSPIQIAEDKVVRLNRLFKKRNQTPTQKTETKVLLDEAKLQLQKAKGKK
ncbi:MAG: hypothetical protein WCF94_00410 [bacterium]